MHPHLSLRYRRLLIFYASYIIVQFASALLAFITASIVLLPIPVPEVLVYPYSIGFIAFAALALVIAYYATMAYFGYAYGSSWPYAMVASAAVAFASMVLSVMVNEVFMVVAILAEVIFTIALVATAYRLGQAASSGVSRALWPIGMVATVILALMAHAIYAAALLKAAEAANLLTVIAAAIDAVKTSQRAWG